MFHRRYASRLVIVPLLAASCVLAISGCGEAEKPQGSLAGTVTYRGKPVTNMNVEVHAEGTGISTSAPIDANGRFAVEAPIPTGTYSVAITPKMFADSCAADAAYRVVLPRKVQNLKTSGLTAEVQKGENDVVIEVKD